MDTCIFLAITIVPSLTIVLVIALTPLWPGIIAVYSIIGLTSWLYISIQSHYTFTFIGQVTFCITVATALTFLIAAAWSHWQAYLHNRNGNGRPE